MFAWFCTKFGFKRQEDATFTWDDFDRLLRIYGTPLSKILEELAVRTEKLKSDADQLIQIADEIKAAAISEYNIKLLAIESELSVEMTKVDLNHEQADDLRIAARNISEVTDKFI